VANLDLGQSSSVFPLSADFESSLWGDPSSVDDSFYWIAEHPWIQPITLDELNHSNLGEVILSTADTEILDLPKGDDQLSPSIALEEVKLLLDRSTSETLSAFTWQLLNEAYASPVCQMRTATMGSVAVEASQCEILQNQFRSGLRLLSIVSTWEQMLARDAPDRLRRFPLPLL
jgi:hypothetical protein